MADDLAPGTEPSGVAARPAGREHGDRAAFLGPARQRLATGVVANPVHVPPPTPLPGSQTPEPVYANLDPTDLASTFAASLAAVEGACHRVEREVPDDLLDRIRRRLPSNQAVVSDEPDARILGERLAGLGMVVERSTPDRAAHAALGITSALAGVAATGSLVLDSRTAGSRTASLLPPVHLCVLPADRLVATPGDVLRSLGRSPTEIPPSLVLVTGPSRTGDIEQLLTLGAHGPTALHVLLVG